MILSELVKADLTFNKMLDQVYDFASEMLVGLCGVLQLLQVLVMTQLPEPSVAFCCQQQAIKTIFNACIILHPCSLN